MNNTTNLTNSTNNNIIHSINDYNFVILLLIFIYNLIIMCIGKNVYYNIVNRINNNNDKFNIINKVLSSYINTDITLNKKNDIVKRRNSNEKINNNDKPPAYSSGDARYNAHGTNGADVIAREIINIDI